MHRRSFLRAVAGVTTVPTLAACVSARGGNQEPEVGLRTVAEGLTHPLALEPDPADPDRLFVADQTGQVYALGPDGLSRFLDVSDRIVDLNSGYDERGLLGFAVHPEFGETGRVFVRYSAPPRQGTPEGYSHTFVLAEFTAPGDRSTADPDTERTLLEVPEPQSNHNAGAIEFGPDGLLYVAVGDGGGAGDAGTGHVEDWYDGNGGGNGQDVTENLLGSILRIVVDERTDVDARDGDRAYGIPDDNPLVGREGRDEHFAWGFRNPWGMSFDGGRFLVADVGQGAWEEINRVEKGGNYGWNVREGAHCYRADDCPTETPAAVRGGEPLRDPVVEYPHSGDGVSGISVVGGYVARDAGVPALEGRYVFGDFRAQGRLFAATPTDDGQWPATTVAVDRPDAVQSILAFGRGHDGALYVLTAKRGGPSGDTGAVHRLVDPADPTETTEATATPTPAGTSTTASAGDGGNGQSDGGGLAGFGVGAALLGGAGALAWRARSGRDE